jgi:hypothetical protein
MAAAITAEAAPTAHMNQDGSEPPLTEGPPRVATWFAGS